MIVVNNGAQVGLPHGCVLHPGKNVVDDVLWDTIDKELVSWWIKQGRLVVEAKVGLRTEQVKQPEPLPPEEPAKEPEQVIKLSKRGRKKLSD